MGIIEHRIGLYNVRGIHSTSHMKAKLSSFLTWGREVGCSLLALTETHTTEEDNPLLTPTFTKTHAVACSSGTDKRAGVALISLSKGISITTKVSALDGRLLVAEVTLPAVSSPLLVALIYAPDSGKPIAKRRRFYNHCWSLIPREVDILLGDFNMTSRPADSTSGPSPTSLVNTVNDLLAHLGVADIAPEDAPHTYHQYRDGKVVSSSRLDRLYTPPDSPLAPRLLNSGDPGLSDHTPLVCSLLADAPISKCPYWKLLPSMISPAFVEVLSTLVEELPDSPTIIQWDRFKRQARAISIALAKSTSQTQQPKPSSVTREEVEEAMVRKAKAARIPVDVARELPGPILSSWVKSSQARLVITELRMSEGQLAETDPRRIMQMMEEYWSSLFTVRITVHCNLPGLLPRKHWQVLSQPFSKQEVLHTLQNTKKASSPGPDGLPYEFYKAFPSLLDKLTALFNHCYTQGVVPASWRTALLRTLPKEDKDVSIVSNYRPIALLCTDFKLLTAILATRLQKELLSTGYFPRHQTGFLSGRSVYEAILRVASWTSVTGSSTCLLDFEKAYDRIQHPWLMQCVEAAGLPPIFCKFLRACLQGCTLQIIVNNTLSAHLKVSSGVRQGDPLSPILFNFCIEPLLLALEKEGIKVQGHADDTAINISSYIQFQRALTIITAYERASGMQLNKGKSSLLGPVPSSWKNAANFKPCLQGDRYLGVQIWHGGKLTLQPRTWESITARIGRLCFIPVSVWGKMTILHSYLRPVLLFQWMVVTEGQHLQPWLTLERRFLHSTTPALSTNTRHIVAADRSHPLNWGRLPPLQWELDRRRVALALSLAEHLPGPRHSIGKRFPSALLAGRLGDWNTPLLPLHNSLANMGPALDLPICKTSKNSQLLCLEKRSLLLQLDKAQALQCMDTWALQRPLVLTKGQQGWQQHFNTDWRSLWTSFGSFARHIRTAIASFLWCLLNRSLPWATYTDCPLCTPRGSLSGQRASLDHLFLHCPRLAGAFHPAPLISLLSPPHRVSVEVAVALWAQWKTACWITHHGADPLQLDTFGLVHSFYDQEMERAKEQHWA
jgi:Reverse transcriptase (RNA-dependent DNA polymerase)